MRSMTAGGVPAGAAMPCHCAVSKPGTAASATVGTSGSSGERLRAGHRQRHQLAALDVRQRRRHAEHADLDLAAHHVADRLAAALVGDVDDVDAGSPS